MRESRFSTRGLLRSAAFELDRPRPAETASAKINVRVTAESGMARTSIQDVRVGLKQDMGSRSVSAARGGPGAEVLLCGGPARNVRAETDAGGMFKQGPFAPATRRSPAREG